MPNSEPPLAPDLPPIEPHRSAQYEFTDEQNRQISGLVDAMRVTAGLMQLLGLSFVVLCTLSVVSTAEMKTGYGPAIALGAAAIVFLCVGFWTGSSAGSFRKIVETKNEDIWHLMNALGTLHSMYGLLRTIILGSLVLAIVGLTLIGITLAGR